MAINPPSAELLELLRVRVGLDADDDSQDAAISTTYIAALSWVEQYLDRYLEAGDYTEAFTHFAGHVASLRGYPVTAVASVTQDDNAEAVPYHLEARNGLVRFDGYAVAHELIVTYTAAPELTGALQVALLGVFDVVWMQLNATVTTDAGEGAVKSITSDGARVEFDVAGGAGGAIDVSSGLPSAITSILNMFRREHC